MQKITGKKNKNTTYKKIPVSYNLTQMNNIIVFFIIIPIIINARARKQFLKINSPEQLYSII